MPEPIKIRATQQGEFTDIRILLQHPMETGRRKDVVTGKLVPAHFIRTFTVSAGDRLLIEGQLNTSVSKNPVFAFRARGLKAGETLVVRWEDNLGERRSDRTLVATG